MTTPILVKYNGSPRAVLRKTEDFGYETFDLVALPRRLMGANNSVPLVEANVDARRVEEYSTPASQLSISFKEESWSSISQRTAARLLAAFLIASDPQRRLEARKAASLMHQLSLVQHVIENESLRRVLIADEVGLGKTIEAGLIIQQLIESEPRIRILYLAPARLARNVALELRDKLELDARCWLAGTSSDARLSDDKIVVASINKAIFENNLQRVVDSGPWDVIIVDECHHLSDWGMGGGKANRSYRLVSQLAQSLPPSGRIVLMSGTPHQGSETRFKNLLKLLSEDGKRTDAAVGRVIFRTKDRVRDWNDRPLFPSREIRAPTVSRLGAEYDAWYNGVGELYDISARSDARARASGWAKGQALQWTASSVHAGLSFLTRLAIRRLQWTTDDRPLKLALESLRPYRGGSSEEALSSLYERIYNQVRAQISIEEKPIDEEDSEDDDWKPDPKTLASLLEKGVELIKSPAASAKWARLAPIIDEAKGEKIVFFAQPVETVSVVAAYLEKSYGQKPAIIIGNQTDEERRSQVTAFQSSAGPQFLVSSKAGGEGLNMQSARRLVHLDVPWNPMELEQWIGRIHRFGSRKTVIVDTLVVAESREVDMYRIARERLRLIASQLDPEQFETLFSRVMSLVPPAELEEVLGASGSHVTDAASDQIGHLVTEGYKSWQKFDDAYRKNAETIKHLSAGEAQWSDVGLFLTRFGNARPGPNSSITSFEFRDDEISTIEESMPTIVVDQNLFVCGDAGGIPVEPVNGNPVGQLGVNLPGVLDRIRKAILPDRAVGAGYFKLKKPWYSDSRHQGSFGALFFLIQSVRQEYGKAAEEQIEIKSFSVQENQEPIELTARECADLIRELADAVKPREPTFRDLYNSLARHEANICVQLRRPSDEDIKNQVRQAVWPLAAVIFSHEP
jgi:superfamily II DNA or RNA helicase